MIASSGGRQPVTFEAPVMASSRGWRPVVEHGGDGLGAEGAVAVALDVPATGGASHGSRLAWCSTTVVTTTSSGCRRSR